MFVCLDVYELFLLHMVIRKYIATCVSKETLYVSEVYKFDLSIQFYFRYVLK